MALIPLFPAIARAVSGRRAALARVRGALPGHGAPLHRRRQRLWRGGAAVGSEVRSPRARRRWRRWARCFRYRARCFRAACCTCACSRCATWTWCAAASPTAAALRGGAAVGQRGPQPEGQRRWRRWARWRASNPGTRRCPRCWRCAAWARADSGCMPASWQNTGFGWARPRSPTTRGRGADGPAGLRRRAGQADRGLAARGRAGRAHAAGAAVPAGRLRLGGRPLWLRAAAAAAEQARLLALPDRWRAWPPCGGRCGTRAEILLDVMEIRIDEGLRAYIDPLTEDRSALERSLLAEGCRDALVLWGDLLIDGHNRYALCRKHNIPFETRPEHQLQVHRGRVSLDDREPPGPAQRCPDFQRGVLALRKREILQSRSTPPWDEGARRKAMSPCRPPRVMPAVTPRVTAGPQPVVMSQAQGRAELSRQALARAAHQQQHAGPDREDPEGSRAGTGAGRQAGEISINAAAAVASPAEVTRLRAVLARGPRNAISKKKWRT